MCSLFSRQKSSSFTCPSIHVGRRFVFRNALKESLRNEQTMESRRYLRGPLTTTRSPRRGGVKFTSERNFLTVSLCDIQSRERGGVKLKRQEHPRSSVTRNLLHASTRVAPCLCLSVRKKNCRAASSPRNAALGLQVTHLFFPPLIPKDGPLCRLLQPKDGVQNLRKVLVHNLEDGYRHKLATKFWSRQSQDCDQQRRDAFRSRLLHPTRIHEDKGKGQKGPKTS